MAEQSTLAQLVDQVSDLTRLVAEHQAYILALVAYQQEQPSYDPTRFADLYADYRSRMKLPAADGDAALQALLRDFEGPIQ